MSTWNKITLFKFQQIDAINNKELPELDKLLFSTCVVYNLTEYQLDNMGAIPAMKLTNKVAAIFSKPFTPEPVKRIGKYQLNYDPSSMRFGQYMELSHYLSSNPIGNAHNVMASISNVVTKANNSEHHGKRAAYFLRQPIRKIIGTLSKFMAIFADFNKSYDWLFGLDKETNDAEVRTDPFNKKYGWMYAAEQVAAYEKIKLNEVYDMNIRNVFNDLAYLKAKSKYEIEQYKKK